MNAWSVGLALMLICGRTIGQPTITEADMPAPGLAWTVHQLSDLPPIASGPNVTWDFSGVVIMESRQLQIEEPSTAPGAANFPSATAVAFGDNGPPYNFIEVTESEMRTLGTMDTAPLIYSDPLSTMVLPCTYGTTWTDTYVNPASQGERTSTADGYGTLVGLGGSFSDVLKVHTEYTSLDTIINDVYYQGLVLQDIFWRNGIGWPLVTSTRSIVYADGQPIQETWVGSALDLLFTGVHELSAETPERVWPNPSTGLFEFSSGHKNAFKVFNSYGASILTGNASVIDLSGQPTGMYSAVISDGQRRRTVQLLLAR